MYDRTSSTTVCAACANLIVPEGARNKWWLWGCRATRVDPIYNPVTGQHDRAPPYALCKAVNGGDCHDYTAGPNIISPREMPK